MSYIGSTPLIGKFKKIDNIASQFNGVLTTFNLLSAGQAVSPGTEMNIIISLDNVILNPGVAYTVSTNQITFATPPTAGKQFFGMLLGSVGTAMTPGDGSVTTASLADAAVTAAKIASGGDASLTQWILKDVGFAYNNNGTASSGTVTMDYSLGAAHRIQIGGAVTLNFSNWSPTNNYSFLFLELVNGGSSTITWPTINWVKKDGSFTSSISTYLSDFGRPSLQSTGIDFFVFWTKDAGATVYGKLM